MTEQLKAFWARLSADKKTLRQAGVLAALVALLLGVGLYRWWSAGPDLSAAPDPSQSGQAANPAAAPVRAGGGGNPAVLLAWNNQLGRDPFALDSTSYTRKPPPPPDPSITPVAPLFPLPPPPPPPTNLPPTTGRADPESPPPVIGPTTAELLAQARKAAAGLHLGGLIEGARPQALIDGKSYSVGDTVGGLLIKKIENHRLVLMMNGVEVELSL